MRARIEFGIVILLVSGHLALAENRPSLPALRVFAVPAASDLPVPVAQWSVVGQAVPVGGEGRRT